MKKVLGFIVSGVILIIFLNILLVLYIEFTTKHPIEKDKKIYHHYNKIESYVNGIFDTNYDWIPDITDDEIWTKLIMEELRYLVHGVPEIKIKKVIDRSDGTIIIYYDFLKNVKTKGDGSYAYEAEMYIKYEKDEIQTVLYLVEN